MTSVVWELIPFIELSAGEGWTQLRWYLSHVVRKLAPNSKRLRQLGQYASSPGHRGYCCEELAVFFLSGGHNIR